MAVHASTTPAPRCCGAGDDVGSELKCESRRGGRPKILAKCRALSAAAGRCLVEDALNGKMEPMLYVSIHPFKIHAVNLFSISVCRWGSKIDDEDGLLAWK